MNSRERLKNTQDLLFSLADNLGNIYQTMRNECMEELIDDKQNHVIQKNEMYTL